MLVFHVPGRVRSKSNHRASSRSGDWAELRAYSELVHALALSARPEAWDENDMGGTARYVTALIARTNLDAGNISKSILDALEGALYAKDKQVLITCDAAWPAAKDQGVTIAIQRVPPDCTIQDASASASQLLTHVAATLTQDARPA